MNRPHKKTNESNAWYIEHNKNFRAETQGCVCALFSIGIGAYIVLVHLAPRVPQWLGILLGLMVLIAPQVIGGLWVEKQKTKNLLERIRTENDEHTRKENE